jgi:hypothetical protein
MIFLLCAGKKAHFHLGRTGSSIQLDPRKRRGEQAIWIRDEHDGRAA